MPTRLPHDTSLWKRSLAPADDSNSVHRDRFRVALEAARKQAGYLAGEISGDKPTFTQHDLSHLDALWDLGDQIAGPDLVLNPAEAFVFGIAALCHDLGMSRASYEATGSDIRSSDEWPDALGRALRVRLGRAPSPAELVAVEPEVEAAVVSELLRDLHAKQAELIPSASWKRIDGTTGYLIEDAELRSAYGALSGLIAASHHWSVDQVVERLSTGGAAGFAPAEWTVDSVLIACLLRTADVAHLDSSRAPDVLAATRKISGLSLDHWTFQNKLLRPFVQDGALHFTSATAFDASQINSWWLAFDVIGMVDTELRAVAAVLERRGDRRLVARCVANAESPKTFEAKVRCIDWEPVDAKIQVSDIAGLVRRLGGEQLYGNRPEVGIRELIMNATDAIRARAALGFHHKTRVPNGQVVVMVEESGGEKRLVVSDNGIGMSRLTMTTSLLDFGGSSWLSPQVVTENPGLAASTFQPSGRFGIGFFSVFMLGSRVAVVSRARTASTEDTWVLEFGDGLTTRAIVRRATRAEQLEEPGTTVSVVLDSKLYRDGELSLEIANIRRTGSRVGNSTLASLIRFLMIASDVDILLSESSSEEADLVVEANDWQSIDGYELICRVIGLDPSPNLKLEDDEDNRLKQLAEHYGPLLQPVYDSSGVLVGRLALQDETSSHRYSQLRDYSVVTAGVCSTGTAAYGTVGLLLGQPTKAARDSSRPIVGRDELRAWFTDRVDELALGSPEPQGDWLRNLALPISELGADIAALRIWKTSRGWVSRQQLVEQVASLPALKVISDYDTYVEKGAHRFDIDLSNDVLVVELGRYSFFSDGGYGIDDITGVDDFYAAGLPGAAVGIVAEAWELPKSAIIDNVFQMETNSDPFPIGTYGGEPIEGRGRWVNRSEIEEATAAGDAGSVQG